MTKYYDVPKSIKNVNNSSSNKSSKDNINSVNVNSVSLGVHNNSDEENEDDIDADIVDSNLNNNQQNIIKDKVIEFECLSTNTLATRTNWCKKQNFSGGNLETCKTNFCDFCCNSNSTEKGQCKNDCNANTITELMSDDIINKCSSINYNSNAEINKQSCKICCDNNKNQ